MTVNLALTRLLRKTDGQRHDEEGDVDNATRQRSHIMELIDNAPWREAVTYRNTWPHEYVVVKKDGQEELLAAFCERIGRGEGVECRFFHQTRRYLFLDDYKYWIMVECDEVDLDAGRRGPEPGAPVPRPARLRHPGGRYRKAGGLSREPGGLAAAARWTPSPGS